ncbi:signal peptidase II [Pseudarthrobacter sp. NIBRBAC000502771]|uniref:signal peptidase II n=1 Tax=Pseudarthrobacter sp. NIBRBAC000502771 TaxID=2590774 RepID=UPI0011327FF2|nr:signal peptidase II [Pseudarthrobacter sp. NIBRBAC000502771]QDG61692.1 signal peptidase II [Pseudarthrobacter sp. NIBRBAC000502771]
MSAQTIGRQDSPAATARRSRAVVLLGAAVLAAADLALKALAEAILSNGTATDLGPINIKLLYNRGVAFSFGADLSPWVVITVTGVIIAALLWYAVTSAPSMTGLTRAGAAALLGGAVGNFVDRLDGQGVVDYFHSGWFPTFNLADVFVTAGAALLVLGNVITRPPRTGH